MESSKPTTTQTTTQPPITTTQKTTSQPPVLTTQTTTQPPATTTQKTTSQPPVATQKTTSQPPITTIKQTSQPPVTTIQKQMTTESDGDASASEVVTDRTTPLAISQPSFQERLHLAGKVPGFCHISCIDCVLLKVEIFLQTSVLDIASFLRRFG